MLRRLRLAAAVLAALGAAGVAWAAIGDRPEPVPDLTCLRKMALDLTHRGPTDDEIAALEHGELDLDELADSYLASAEFERVAFDWMRTEFPPTERTTEAIDIEEPARLMHRVLVADRDWREILTAGYTIDPDGAERVVAGRPAAGILATPYYLASLVGDLRRTWAGRFERQFAGIVLVAVTLAPGEAVDSSREGLAANPACAGCHVHPTYGIDALARFADCYDGAGERIAGCVDPEASFLLETGRGLADLGRITAATHEFKSQSIDFFFKRMFGRDLAREEVAYYGAAARTFADSGYRARALLRFFVTSKEYCSR